MLDPVALAWASWAGLAVGVIGTLVSAVGLWLTFQEARRARVAAQSAALEVAKVVAQTRARTRLSALSSAVTMMDSIRARIEDGTLATNRELFTAFRRAVQEALVTTSGRDNARGTRHDQADAGLEEIARLVDEDMDSKLKRPQMHAALHRISDFLIAQEAMAKTEDLA